MHHICKRFRRLIWFSCISIKAVFYILALRQSGPIYNLFLSPLKDVALRLEAPVGMRLNKEPGRRRESRYVVRNVYMVEREWRLLLSKPRSIVRSSIVGVIINIRVCRYWSLMQTCSSLHFPHGFSMFSETDL